MEEWTGERMNDRVTQRTGGWAEGPVVGGVGGGRGGWSEGQVGE